MSQERTQTLIASVQRALTLVDIVASAPRPVPVKTISRVSGLTLGTAYNITRTITEELGVIAYLSRYDDGQVHVVDIVDAHPTRSSVLSRRGVLVGGGLIGAGAIVGSFFAGKAIADSPARSSATATPSSTAALPDVGATTGAKGTSTPAGTAPRGLPLARAHR